LTLLPQRLNCNEPLSSGTAAARSAVRAYQLPYPLFGLGVALAKSPCAAVGAHARV
jgi:hypothetical protein